MLHKICYLKVGEVQIIGQADIYLVSFNKKSQKKKGKKKFPPSYAT